MMRWTEGTIAVDTPAPLGYNQNMNYGDFVQKMRQNAHPIPLQRFHDQAVDYDDGYWTVEFDTEVCADDHTDEYRVFAEEGNYVSIPVTLERLAWDDSRAKWVPTGEFVKFDDIPATHQHRIIAEIGARSFERDYDDGVR